VIYFRLRLLIPRPLARYVKHFEAGIEDAVQMFASHLAPDSRVLDAGAGEGRHKRHFTKQRYYGVDLAVGDPAWNYTGLDVRSDLARLPFRDGSFDAALNIVTLEHVTEPSQVLCELSRVLAPAGRILIVAPHQWEEHQQPHDYYRYTRYGLDYLLRKAGFTDITIVPVGGMFRMLGRRMLNAIEFLPTPLDVFLMGFFIVTGLTLPLLDRLDRRRNYTLGYICSASKPSSPRPYRR
jgi:SAM-dependent methyltransferase